MFLKSINRITITENLTTTLMPAIWVEEVSSFLFSPEKQISVGCVKEFVHPKNEKKYFQISLKI